MWFTLNCFSRITHCFLHIKCCFTIHLSVYIYYCNFISAGTDFNFWISLPSPLNFDRELGFFIQVKIFESFMLCLVTNYDLRFKIQMLLLFLFLCCLYLCLYFFSIAHWTEDASLDLFFTIKKKVIVHLENLWSLIPLFPLLFKN